MTNVDTLTLAEFLLARIAEDEARVESLTGEWPDEIAVVPHSDAVQGCVAISRPGPKAYARVWLTDASPDFGWRYHESGVVVWSAEIAARVLAECEAKRKIVERCQLAYQLYLDGFAHEILADDVLGQLAMPYADHPDYRAEWKPESR